MFCYNVLFSSWLCLFYPWFSLFAVKKIVNKGYYLSKISFTFEEIFKTIIWIFAYRWGDWAVNIFTDIIKNDGTDEV